MISWPNLTQTMQSAASVGRTARLLAVAGAVSLAAGLFLIVDATMTLGKATAVEARIRAAAEQTPRAQLGISHDDIVRMFNEIYYNSGISDSVTWLDVLALQNPPDMWAIQEVITEVQPDYFVESGTFHGGSALFFAMVMDALGGPGKVLTIDVDPHAEEAERYAVFRKRVEVFAGSSTDDAIVDKIRERTKGKRVIVMLDSDHHRDNVLRELEVYGPMVSPGSYLIVQDTNLNGHPVKPRFGPGPWDAVQQYLPAHPEFTVDRAREKFMVTFTPSGFLRKRSEKDGGT
jgi:cephalosporin hydroxylase